MLLARAIARRTLYHLSLQVVFVSFMAYDKYLISMQSYVHAKVSPKAASDDIAMKRDRSD